jgi:uncharacterized LabA/DUF88 family protein
MVTGRVAFFIDGFNLYHALHHAPPPYKHREFRKYKWLDLAKLCRILIPRKCTVAKIYYFTTYPTWDTKKVSRHQMYVRALQTTPVEIVLGRFKKKEISCPLCKGTFEAPIEKQTDVNIAIKLVQAGLNDLFDTAVIISGDTDLVPAVQGVQQLFPTKQIGFVFPMGRTSNEIRQIANFTMRLSERHVSTCQFPDKIQLSGGVTIERPDNWR